MRFLYKASVYCSNNDTYSINLTPLNKSKNKSNNKALVFRGTEEEFIKWLRKVKATDSLKGKPSEKTTTYQGILDSIKQGLTTYMYIWSNKINTNKLIINESFLNTNLTAKEYLEEIIE